jgi:hypothetical protein
MRTMIVKKSWTRTINSFRMAEAVMNDPTTAILLRWVLTIEKSVVAGSNDGRLWESDEVEKKEKWKWDK